MWDISKRALAGELGIFTHVSYRSWPAKIISMLRTISNMNNK